MPLGEIPYSEIAGLVCATFKFGKVLFLNGLVVPKWLNKFIVLSKEDKSSRTVFSDSFT